MTSKEMLTLLYSQAICFASFSVAFKGVARPGEVRAFLATQYSFSAIDCRSRLTIIARFSLLVQVEETASLETLFYAGSLSGLATVVVTTPTDLLKIRLQVQKEGGGSAGSRQFRGMFDVASVIWRQEGVKGFFRGAVATAHRDTLSTGFYFTVYHSVKRALMSNPLFTQNTHSNKGADLSSVRGSSTRNGEIETMPSSNGSVSNASRTAIELFAGGAAGTLAWGTVIPFDVVKTRLQSQQPPGVSPAGSIVHQEQRFWPALRLIVEKEGFARLYSGATPLLARAFLVNAVTFYAYEESLRFIQ
jgi:solute carrier family 25 carnitine/acylcarnitine transporter 20/29